MEQSKGIHLVSGRTDGHTSSQVLESMGMQKKARCFACNETSHSLDQCSIKYKLVTVAHQYGYATKFPFSMIQPSEEMLEKEKFFHHCVRITSNVSNLDLGALKGELQKLWNLSGGWELKRECTKSFLASFSSQGDIVSCLKKPYMKTLLDGKEVKLNLTKWTEGDDESNNDLIKQWFLVSGVPRKYRAWMELYQVASAFGVLIDVDEGSLEVGDKEAIRLKIALRNHDSAPFSYHYVVGWSSRMVILTVEAKIDSQNNSHNTRVVTSTGNHELTFGDFSNKEHEKELNAPKSKLLEEPKFTEDSTLDGKTKENKKSTPAATVNNSKTTTIRANSILLEGPTFTEESRIDGKAKGNKISTPAATINNSKTTTIRGLTINYVYKRRGKKQEGTEAVNKSPSDELDKGVGPKSSNVTTFGASEMTRERQPNTEEITLMGVSKKSEETGACREKEDNSVTLATTTINSKERKIPEYSSKTEKAQLVTARAKEIVSTDESLATTTINSKETKLSEDSSKTEKAQLVTARAKEIVSRDESLATTTTNSNERKLSEDSSKTEKAQLVTACAKEILSRDESLATTTINSKERKISEDSSKTEKAQLVTARTKEIVSTDESLATTTINSKETKLSEDSSKTEKAQLVTARAKVTVPRDEEIKPIVMQFYVKVEKEDMKLCKLHAVLKSTGLKKVIVFVNKNDKLMSLTEDVSKHYTVSISHDGMDQHARDTAIKKFQFGSSSVLIATDLGGATNAMQVPVVINYDLPTQSMQYIHRVHQQNGEPGRRSVVINLVTRDDECVLSDIQRLCNGEIRELELPDN